MKVLFITNNTRPDYQHDMVFHCLRMWFGPDCVDTTKLWYMYEKEKNQFWNERIPNNGKSYGWGFTIHGLLDDYNTDRTDIESKIKNKFFDKIVYGSIRRCTDYLDLVFQSYSPKDILFIDGEDGNDIDTNYLNKGIYYKRELVVPPTDMLKPISFAIPMIHVLSMPPIKLQDWGKVIPGQPETYIFTKQEDYYKDYEYSYVALTFKKGGWDCLRHYEILANGCLPYFPDLADCPPYTMVNFPKQTILETNKLIAKGEIPTNYEEIIQDLLIYTKKNLTTEMLIDTLFPDENFSSDPTPQYVPIHGPVV